MSLFKIICFMISLLLVLIATAPVVAYDDKGMSFIMIASESEQGYVTIYLADGGILIGKIVASDENTIKIENISGEQITVYRNYIKEIKQDKQTLSPTYYDDEGKVIIDEESKKLPLNSNWMAGGILAGYFIGGGLSLVGGAVGGRIGNALWPSGPCYAEPGGWEAFCALNFTEEQLFCIIFGLSVGYVLGSAIGVYIAGTGEDVTGSFLSALSGSLIGCFIPIVGSPIIAAIALNRTRRYKPPLLTTDARIVLPLLRASF